MLSEQHGTGNRGAISELRLNVIGIIIEERF